MKRDSREKTFTLSSLMIALTIALLMTLSFTSVNAQTLPAMSLTVTSPNGTSQTLDNATIGNLSSYSGYGGFWKNGAPNSYANYTGVPLTTLCNLVGGVNPNTFVDVISTVGSYYDFNFSCTQVVNGIINATSSGDDYPLTTANLLDVQVNQTQPITMMLAYEFANGTLIPSSHGPLYLTFVGPEGLLVVPTSLSGGKPWVSSVTNVSIWWIGDFYCNHTVDYDDIVYFVQAYIAANSATPTVNPRCDFNCDGQINYNDIIAFVDCYIAANTP